MTRSQILEVLRSNLHRIVESARDRELDETLSMKDFGADSLEIVEVASRTMKELRVRIPRTELSKAKTIGQLLDLLERAAPMALAS